MEVRLIWNTPDPEFQIVRALRFASGTLEDTDSRWVQVGLESGPDGKMKMSYPMFKVKLGPRDTALLKKDKDTLNFFWCSERVYATFGMLGLSKKTVDYLRKDLFDGAIVSNDGTGIQVCGSFNDYIWALRSIAPCQLDLFQEDKQKPLLELAKQLYELAPVVFADYKDTLYAESSLY